MKFKIEIDFKPSSLCFKFLYYLEACLEVFAVDPLEDLGFLEAN